MTTSKKPIRPTSVTGRDLRPYHLPVGEVEKWLTLTRAKRAQQGRPTDLYSRALWRLEIAHAIATELAD